MATTTKPNRPRSSGESGSRRPKRPTAEVRLTGRSSARQYATIHRVDPWSVLKYSLVLHFALVIVLMVALTLLWAVVQRLGLMDLLTQGLAKVDLVFELRPANIARSVFLIGTLNTIVASAVNLFIAFLYNLISDLMGGIRLELAADN
ncbi:DUF3566 domain-containing protein [Stomatohabitans albus]|uniref:DUF3566 domain-containing protein n=1 Tax=Stomatohabitans albus TaxID=3110766 RepID=UPI00300C2289